MNIEKAVRTEFGSKQAGYLDKLLGRKKNNSLKPGIDRAIDLVVSGFTTVAEEEIGRESLYEAIRYCDDSVVDDPASMYKGPTAEEAFVDGNNRLASLVGIASRNHIVDTVATESSLPVKDAEKVVGYVVPGVIGVLKRQIGRGEVLDTVDGIGQMFLGEGLPLSAEEARISASARAAVDAGKTTAIALDDELDQSWLFRYLLPAVLLGGLVLGGMKNCGNGVANRLAADTRLQKAAEIQGLRDAHRVAVDRVAVVEDEKALADAKNQELTSRVERLSADLGDARQSALDSLELQGSLSSITIQRDTAIDTNIRLRGDLDKAVAERDITLEETVRLNAELENAYVKSADYETELAGVQDLLDETVASLGQMRRDNDGLKIQSTERQARLKKLSAQLAAGLVEAKKSQAANSTAQVEIARLREVLKKERNPQGVDVKQLVSNADDLNAQIKLLNDTSADTQAKLADSESEVSRLNGRLLAIENLLATLRTDNDRLIGEVSALQEERDQWQNQREALQTRQAELITENEEAGTALADRDSQIVQLSDELARSKASATDSVSRLGVLTSSFNDLKSQLSDTNDSRDKLSALTEGLQGEVARLKQDKADLDVELEVAGEARQKAQKVLSELRTEHDKALSELSAMQLNMDTVIADRDQIQVTVGTMEKDRALLKNAVSKEKNAVSELTASIDALKGAKAVETTIKDDLIEKLEINLVEAQKNSYEQRAKISNLESDIKMLRSDLDNANGSVTRLQAEISASNTASEGLQLQLDDARSTSGGLEEKLVIANRSVASLKERLQKAEDQIGLLGSRESKLREQIDAANTVAQAEQEAAMQLQGVVADSLNSAGLQHVFVETLDEGRAVSIRLGSGDLYTVGSATLSEKGSGILETVGDVVSRFPDWKVDVEGHTDSQKIGVVLRKKFPTNWELSVVRASAAVRYLQSSAGIDADRMSARGFGDTKPLASNETVEGRKKNRRVEVIMRPTK